MDAVGKNPYIASELFISHFISQLSVSRKSSPLKTTSFESLLSDIPSVGRWESANEKVVTFRHKRKLCQPHFISISEPLLYLVIAEVSYGSQMKSNHCRLKRV